MALLAKRVNAFATSSTWTSVSSGPWISTDEGRCRRCGEVRARGEARKPVRLPSLTWARISLVRKGRSDAHVAKTRRRGSVARAHGLHGLAFSAIRRPPKRPVAELADSVAGIPELRGDTAVAGILQHPDFLPALDFPSDFGRKLKLVAAVVDGPGAICLHEDSVVCVGEEIVVVPSTREQADVRHSNDGQTIPTFRAHGSR